MFMQDMYWKRCEHCLSFVVLLQMLMRTWLRVECIGDHYCKLKSRSIGSNIFKAAVSQPTLFPILLETMLHFIILSKLNDPSLLYFRSCVPQASDFPCWLTFLLRTMTVAFFERGAVSESSRTEVWSLFCV